MKFFKLIRPVVTLTAFIATVHLILVLNKGYVFNGVYYSKDKFDLWIRNLPADERGGLAFNTQIVYFYFFPESVISGFYISYLTVVAFILTIYNIKSRKEREFIKEKMAEKIKDFQIRLGVANVANRNNTQSN